MTKEEFKLRWESSDNGGGITFNEIADCAIKWSLCRGPKTFPIDVISYLVLKAANTEDADQYKPVELEDEE